MLHIITGRAGSGKTTYVNGILGELAQGGNDKLLLIVPEQFSFASERAILTSFGTRDAQRIEVLSFTRLADYVGRSLGGLAHEYADEGTKIIIMLRALGGIRDELQFYASHVESVALARELISLVSEFKKERVTPQMLREASDKTEIQTLSVKLRELALIYAAYTSLFENKYDDTDTIPDKLCDTLSANNFFAGYTIAIDAFKGFTAQEFEIIQHLCRQAEDVYITLCTDDIYGKDPSMIWDAVNETGKRLARIAKDEGIPVTVYNPGKDINCTRFNSPAFTYIEHNLFHPSVAPFSESTDDVTLCAAQNLRDECNFIASTARKLMRADGIRLKDMAVIVRSEDTYKRELVSAFSRFGIPAFEDVRQPIMNQPLISLCKSVLEIMTGGFTTENILHYLKTGLSPLSDLEVAELENYALMWGLNAKSWRSDFTLSPGGMNSKPDEKFDADLARLNDMRKRAIFPLIDLKNSLSAKSNSQNNCEEITALRISESIYKFLIKTGVDARLKDMARDFAGDGYTALATEQNRIWEILMDTLNKLGTVYGDYATALNTYYNLFCAVISSTDLGSIPHGLDEITIGAADRIRLSNPKVVFVAGCAEGVFPRTTDRKGLLTASDRRNLLALGIELSAPSELKACEERFIAYSALTAATDKLYVSYHRTEGASDSLLPSIIYENIYSLFDGEHGGLPVIDTDTLPVDYFAETEESSFAAYAAAFAQRHQKRAEDDFKTFLASLRAAVKATTNYADKLASLDSVVRQKKFKIKDPKIATELFGKYMGVSASRVETYHHCAFQYFCKYGLRAMPREKAELNPAVAGTVIHYVLEKIIMEHGKDGLISMNIDGRKAAVDKWLLTYLHETIGGFDDKTLRFRYLYNRLAFTLYDIVSRLCAEFAASDFTPCDFELNIGNENEGVPAYKLELENGGHIAIYGSVDRVDKYEKDGKTYIRVVDYKSGGKDFVLSDVLSGLNMQMLIYLFAIEAGGEKRYGNVVPSGVLYYPAKRNTVSMTNKSMSADEIQRVKEKADAGNGLFLLDDDILEAMEHGKAGRFISIVDGRGNLKDNLITLENMGRLRQRIDDVLRDMANDLQSGKIPAYPVRSGHYDRTCEYCDYSSVCRFEDGDTKEIQKMKSAEVYELLANEYTDSAEGGADNE